MDVPFPSLTYLLLSSEEETVPVLPDSFLGGSAPRLQTLELNGIQFPSLARLLLSTSYLVDLHLPNIPYSGYISPAAMVTNLSALTSLKSLSLKFRFVRTQADRESRHPPPLTRVVLPALTEFYFRGDSEYVEDFVSRIDAPLLDRLVITFFNQLTFYTPRLRHFISLTEAFKATHRARILLYDDHVYITLLLRHGVADHEALCLGISTRAADWQLSSISQVCSSSLPQFPALERLDIHDCGQYWNEDIEHSQWLELLFPFVFVKDLVISEELIPLVAPVLQAPARDSDEITQVMPNLKNVFSEGPSHPELFHIPFGGSLPLDGSPVNYDSPMCKKKTVVKVLEGQ
jgi:hypothetical protein